MLGRGRHRTLSPHFFVTASSAPVGATSIAQRRRAERLNGIAKLLTTTVLSFCAFWGYMQDSLAAAVCIKVLAMANGVRLQTWLDAETKERFSAVARHEGLSDSALLKRLVDLMLQTAHAGQSALRDPGDSGRATATRVSVRLRPDDLPLLQQRAAARGLRPATYLSVLARSHLHRLAPLPREELLAVKRAVSELTAIGRNLNQLAHAAQRGDRVTGPNREVLSAMLKVCSGLRDHVRGLLAANLRSWDQGHDDPK